MALSAEHYSERAAFYEKAAEDARVSREGRMLFARKANWLRILARLTAKGNSEAGATGSQKDFTGISREALAKEERSEALLFSPRRLAGARTSMMPPHPSGIPSGPFS
jgi:hypothetical protein